MNVELEISELNKDLKKFKAEFEIYEAEYAGELDLSSSLIEDICNSHSLTYYGVIQNSVQAKRLLKRAELLVKNIKAELGLKIRKERDEQGLKTTEGSLQELIDSNLSAQEARDIRSECELLDYEITMLISAFEHRRSMINNRVTLAGFGKAVDESNAKTMREKTGVRRRV